MIDGVANKRHPLYQTWNQMWQRCTNPKRPAYKYYGARGICVDLSWKSLEQFIRDVGVRPEGCTLDRKDTDGPYSSGNCRWSTVSEQNSNKRPSRLYSNNTSGLKNIHKRSDSGKYQVFTWSSGKRKSAGVFTTLEAAQLARDSH